MVRGTRSGQNAIASSSTAVIPASPQPDRKRKRTSHSAEAVGNEYADGSVGAAVQNGDEGRPKRLRGVEEDESDHGDPAQPSGSKSGATDAQHAGPSLKLKMTANQADPTAAADAEQEDGNDADGEGEPDIDMEAIAGPRLLDKETKKRLLLLFDRLTPVGTKLIDEPMDAETCNISTSEGPVTLRAVLEADLEVSEQELMIYLHGLARKAHPSAENPFPLPHDAPVAVAASLAGRKPTSPAERYLADLYSVAVSCLGAQPARKKTHFALSQSTVALPSDKKLDKRTSEWFTSLAKIEAGDVESEDALASLLSNQKFGRAQVVSVQPASASTKSGPTLKETLLVGASAKADKWRAELRSHRRRDHVGFLGDAVRFTHYSSGFTPTFAPTHDSSKTSSGWGYDSTIQAARQLATDARFKSLGRRVGRDWKGGLYEGLQLDGLDDGKAGSSTPTEAFVRELASLPDDASIDPELLSAAKLVEDDVQSVQRKLDENAKCVQELLIWQDIRLPQGRSIPHALREKMLTAVVQENLRELAGSAAPSALVDDNFSAIQAAQRFISTPGPNIRGTLEPAKSKPLADNNTLKARDPATIAPASTGVPPVPAKISPALPASGSATPGQQAPAWHPGRPPPPGGQFTPTQRPPSQSPATQSQSYPRPALPPSHSSQGARSPMPSNYGSPLPQRGYNPMPNTPFNPLMAAANGALHFPNQGRNISNAGPVGMPAHPRPTVGGMPNGAMPRTGSGTPVRGIGAGLGLPANHNMMSR